MQFIGQKHNLSIIEKWAELPQFIILQGEHHTGKTYMTLYLCQKYKLTYVASKSKVSDVRSLIDVMRPNSNILYHFKDFEDATIQAKNALLKITEEPIPGNYIVITGGPQIPTLESRARKLIMEPFSDTEMKTYMAPYFEDAEVQQKLLMAGINTPAKVEYYRKYAQIQQLLEYAHDIFSKLTYMNPGIYVPMLAKFEDRYDIDYSKLNESNTSEPRIDSVKLFLDMLINIVEYNVRNNHYYSYNTILNILLRNRRALELEPTLKRKLLLFRIFYEISVMEGK